MDACAPSKTHEFLCFQIIHGTSKAVVPRPFRIGLGVPSFTSCHHEANDVVLSSGVVQGI